MAPEAICIACGAEKRRPWEPCAACRFDPASERHALVRSVYFSSGRFEDTDEQVAWVRQLPSIAELIRSGRAPVCDENELRRLDEQLSGVEHTTSGALVEYLLRVFAPAGLLIGALIIIWLLIRALK
jgi:hypothetical protein